MTLKEVKSARDFCKVAKNIVLLQCHKKKCDSGSVGRALASQAEGRGFESRLSLYLKIRWLHANAATFFVAF